MITSNLQLLMRQKGTSLKKLSEAATVTENSVIKARRSSRIIDCKLSTLVKIAEALNCSVKDLFEHELENKNKKDT